MSRIRFEPGGMLRPAALHVTAQQGIILVLFALNLFFNIVGNAAFKVSAASSTLRGFLAWQIVGNIAGFITVLTLTALLRFLPLGVAYPVTMGLAVIGVQVVAAALLFGETITQTQFLGTLCIVLGIVLIGGR